jgi:hypothetical protein
MKAWSESGSGSGFLWTGQDACGRSAEGCKLDDVEYPINEAIRTVAGVTIAVDYRQLAENEWEVVRVRFSGEQPTLQVPGAFSTEEEAVDAALAVLAFSRIPPEEA